MPQDRKGAKASIRSKIGRSDRYPSDYGVRDREEREKAQKNDTDRSSSSGHKGQTREGKSKRG